MPETVWHYEPSVSLGCFASSVTVNGSILEMSGPDADDSVRPRNTWRSKQWLKTTSFLIFCWV